MYQFKFFMIFLVFKFSRIRQINPNPQHWSSVIATCTLLIPCGGEDGMCVVPGWPWCSTRWRSTWRPSMEPGRHLKLIYVKKKSRYLFYYFQTFFFHFEIHGKLAESVTIRYRPWRRLQSTESQCAGNLQYFRSVLQSHPPFLRLRVSPSFRSDYFCK